ncbi:MAG TPA: UDP-N-acetylglucosamine 2-epimerase (hydrolyzing), partial [Rhodospirillaceae bacterium]|nr:UDP-N-acetylglucosamine 2-epimerase (hydrolyzing) [Rhodospirillaceae bacterium]
MRRRICVWNGKRGGFGALAPTMEAITAHPGLELQLVVTDQHLY